jgi:hypothetical protein
VNFVDNLTILIVTLKYSYFLLIKNEVIMLVVGMKVKHNILLELNGLDEEMAYSSPSS